MEIPHYPKFAADFAAAVRRIFGKTKKGGFVGWLGAVIYVFIVIGIFVSVLGGAYLVLESIFFSPTSIEPKPTTATNKHTSTTIESANNGISIGRNNNAPITTTATTNNYPTTVFQPVTQVPNAFARRYTDTVVVSSSIHGGNDTIDLDGAGILRLSEDVFNYLSDTFNSTTLLLNSIPISARSTSSPSGVDTSYTPYSNKYEFNENQRSNTVTTNGRIFTVTLQKVNPVPPMEMTRDISWPYTGWEYTFGISEQ